MQAMVAAGIAETTRRGILLLVGALLVSTSTIADALNIQVCQNKDCCSRWKYQTPLPEVLHDLLGEKHTIETISCFSQCGNGPNVCVNTPKIGEVFLREITDPTTAAAHLEASASVQIPSKLLAAVSVLEKAKTGT